MRKTNKQPKRMKTNNKNKGENKKLLKQVLKKLLQLPIKLIMKLVNYIKENKVESVLFTGIVLILVWGFYGTLALNNMQKSFEQNKIEQEETYKNLLEEKLNVLQQQIDELKEITDTQQEETNSRLEELDVKITSRKAQERKVASATTTQPTSELQEYAHNLVINEYGWTEEDFTCLVNLWNRESGWNPNAHNSSSGAHGIPQALPASKMASEGDDYYTNGETQIRWGLGYIAGRYGSPSNAWSHFQDKNWY